MIREKINTYCQSLPGSLCSDPWGGGHDVWKLNDKSYVILGTQNQGVTVKCVDSPTADLLIELGRAEKAAYLPRGGWVFLRFDSIEPDEILDRVRLSYLTVRGSLSKKAQAALAPID